MKPYLIEITFFSIFLIASSLRAAQLALHRRRIALAFISGNSEELVFHERDVTAFSDNGLLSDFGSRQSLELVLTRSELWLRDTSATAPDNNERLCSVVLSSIRSIRRQGKFIKIDFLGSNGLADALLLRLNDRQDFLDRLHALVLPGPALPVPLRRLTRAAEEAST